MATKTATCVANGLKFEDPTGIQHTVTTSQTFTLDLTDGGIASVAYRQNINESVTTIDGRTLTFRRNAENATNGTGNGNAGRTFGPTADTQDAAAVLGEAGEFCTSFDEGNIIQNWKSETLTVDDIDTPTLISGRFKDQFSHYMDWVGLTVA